MDLANERARHPSHVEAARLSGALSGGGGAVMPGLSTPTFIAPAKYSTSDAIHGNSCGAPDAIDGNSSRTCAASPLTHGADSGQQQTAIPDWRLRPTG